MKPFRGQAILLFSLTILLVALMVLVTLSLGAKVRNRMDLQTVADAAAYSNAVATARTMNAIAVMNRAIIAHDVSTLGTISIISWATLYWKHAQNARNIFLVQFLLFVAGYAFWEAICVLPFCAGCWACPIAAACAWGMIPTGVSLALMTIYESQLHSKLTNDIQVFNNETTPRWLASNYLYQQSVNAYTGTLKQKLTQPGSGFADTFIPSANLQSTTALATATAGINDAELEAGGGGGGGLSIPSSSGAGLSNTDHAGNQPYHIATMAMGSRGHQFTVYRGHPGWQWTLDLTLPWSLPNITWVHGNGHGKGYLNNPPSYDAMPEAGQFAGHGHPGGDVAHDDGDRTSTILTIGIGGLFGGGFTPYWIQCLIFGWAAQAYGIIGKSTGKVEVDPNNHPPLHGGPHSYQTFPSFYDYNPTALFNPDDLYGQPKNLTMLAKDLSTSTDPWDLNVGMKFSPAGSRFDMVGEPASWTNGKQMAMGAGITYYSRPGAWDEPPNFFAPYWHATLGRPTIDRPQNVGMQPGYDSDMTNMLNSTGQSEAGVLYNQLVNDGYAGFK
jgi:hypothetical protein